MILVTHDGAVTPAGALCYHTRPHEPAPDRRFDLAQTPVRQGDSEFARDRTGRLVRLRTLTPTGDFRYLSLIHI